MGLDTSHDAWHGSYGRFNQFRSAVCASMGGKWPSRVFEDDYWTWGEGFSHETHPGLYIFLTHSDCDGEISAVDCGKVARDLSLLRDKIDPEWLERLDQFIAGCELAFASNEELEFS